MPGCQQVEGLIQHWLSDRVPAAVITSSGTAVANLLPAVVEAGQAGVPLLLLTADRPGELRGCGANQTIDQARAFQHVICHAVLEHDSG